MKRKRRWIALLAASLLLGMTGCGKKEVNEPKPTAEPSVEPTAEPVTFKDFAGNYYFSSGVGGWATEVAVYENGTFGGVFYDSDMGVTGEGYPNGTMYLCEFDGKFSELEKKDDYTYSCMLEEMTQTEETGLEVIDEEEGIRYIYADPYGFDNGEEFEFYLPGKNVADCSEDLLIWMNSLRYNTPYPDTFINRSFSNVNNWYGFEESIDYSQPVDVNYPQSLPLDPFELSGSYCNYNLKVIMNIDMFGEDYDNSDPPWGKITWELPDTLVGWNADAMLQVSDNGFDAESSFYGKYKIIVTDNTSENVVVHLYDERGHDCGEYVMTLPFKG